MSQYRYSMIQGLTLAIFFCANVILNFAAVLWFNGTWGATLCSALTNINAIWIILLTYQMVRLYTETFNNHLLTYSEGVSLVVSLFFFASIITAAVRLALLLWQPEFITLTFDNAIKALQTLDIPQVSQEQFDIAMQQLKTPFNFVMQYLWVDTLLGLMLAIPMAFFTRRKQPPQQNDNPSQQ
ncbi:MAG TPA: hypothetical protein DEO38_06180 [Bacteroidales bacterium]|nr:hypothetical protein [Bacteroidales bacterium]